MLVYAAGLRVSEVVRLRHGDLDYVRRLLNPTPKAAIRTSPSRYPNPRFA
jgi:site-specific recombinase XerD